MRKLHNLYIWFDYSIFLPFCAFLPLCIGRALCTLRGIVYFYLKRDWRSFTFGYDTLFERALQSYKEIFPKKNEKQYLDLAKKRYIAQSLEEYDAMLAIQGKFNGLHVCYHNEKPIVELMKENPHQVFVTSHFGSSIEAFIFLQIFQTPILVMTSNVTKHHRVHRSITKFYDKKYRSIEPFLHGGQMLDAEGNTKEFYRFLHQIGSLAIVADLPPGNAKNTKVEADFFGKKRAFAGGASRLANKMNTNPIPYVCYYEDGGYHMVFGDLDVNPYAFFESQIKKRPHLWWASDLLQSYPKIQEKAA